MVRRHVFTSQAVRPAKDKTGRPRKRSSAPAGGGGGLYAVLFLIALIFFGFDQANHRLAEVARGYATDLSLPVLETTSGAISAVRSMLRTTRDYADLAGEYETLRAENRQLKALRSEAHIVEARARSYENLLNYVPEDGSESIAVRTIADVQSPFAHSVIVNAGADRGLVNGLAVLGETGLVGRIISTGDRTARVLLVTDVNSRIPVFVGTQRHRALLAGTNRSVLSLMHLPASAILAAGDAVVTSGEGQLLPAGLTVGGIRIVRDGQPEVVLGRRPGEADVLRVLKYTSMVDIEPMETPLPVALSEDVEAMATPGGATPGGATPGGAAPGGVAGAEMVQAVATVQSDVIQPPGME